jgi:hypothetical protein
MTITLTREEAQQVLDAMIPYQQKVIATTKEYGVTVSVNNEIETAIEILRARLSAPECVCGEPNTAGVHRQDGPCYQQPEPEPVAGYRWEEGRTPPSVTFTAPPQREWKYDPMTGEPLIDGWPLYSGLPNPWQGLTDEEIKSLLWETRVDNLKFARVIETLLREKNAS